MTDPIAETSNGKLRGVEIDGVHIFKGVRYGASTACANRFMPPQPPSKWAGVQDALNWGASAPQNPVPLNTDPFYAWYSAIQPVSEDCLFLNVFTPALADGGKRPVMFWIHGGGWREFSGTAPGFDGTNLARAQDVVVVTINHRLGAFGYLYLGEADSRFADAANAGLLDILLALTWVRDNAAAFGGDAGNVTLFGESGGASKIAALLSMRAAHGLFHKAIVQSSAGGLHLTSQQEAIQGTAELARALGLHRVDAEALQKTPMPTMLAALRGVGANFRGTIDGRYFTQHPFDPAATDVSRHIPLLAGCTNTETSYYLRGDPHNFALSREDVIHRLSRFLMIERQRAERIAMAYQAVYAGYEPSDILVMVTSDFIFKRTTYRIAALHAAIADVPVFAYLFDHDSPIEGGRMRSPHTSEVPFIFGTARAAAACVGDGDDIAPITRLMMAAWGEFARGSNPNNGLLPEWRPFTATTLETMVLNTHSQLARDPGGAARATLHDIPRFGYGHSFAAFSSN